MAKFIGLYEAKLDDKGRVVVPSSFKSVVTEEFGATSKAPLLRFVIKKNLFADCLDMFTYEQWSVESEQIRSKLNLFRKEDAAWYREYMSDRALVTLDQKVGRIIIPKQLLQRVGIKKEIVFAGNDFKIEIWAKENFGKGRMSESTFTKLTEKLLG